MLNPQKTESHQSDLIPKIAHQAKQKKYSRKHPFFEKFKFSTKINKQREFDIKSKQLFIFLHELHEFAQTEDGKLHQ